MILICIYVVKYVDGLCESFILWWVQHWQPYIWEQAFTVGTDHYSLKFLLDQHLSRILQHMWVSKLFRYDLTVEYRPSKLNGVANVLSRRTEEAAAVHAISTLTFELFGKLQSESAPDPQVADVISLSVFSPSANNIVCKIAYFQFRVGLENKNIKDLFWFRPLSVR
jgi:hypothetical protein